MEKTRVMESLTALAAGADPFTGEEWPEKQKLEKAHGEGRSIRDIAKALERTPGAIHSRLLRLGLIEVP